MTTVNGHVHARWETETPPVTETPDDRPSATVRLVERDHEAEALLVGGLIIDRALRDVILSRVGAEAFDPEREDGLARSVLSVFAADPTLDLTPTMLAERLKRPRRAVLLARWADQARDAVLTSHAAAEMADRVAMVGARARAQKAALDLAEEAVNGSVTVDALLGDFAERAERVQLPETGTDEPPLSIEDFLAIEDPPEDWVIPNFMARGERLILTATAGVGKSTELRSMAATCAAGLHPFTHHLATEQPPRVLYIDLENPPAKVRRGFRVLAATAAQYSTFDPERLAVVSENRHVDLRRPQGWAWLASKVEAHRADLVFIGPLYRLFPMGQNNEFGGIGDANAVAKAFDLICQQYGVALVIEAHTSAQSGVPFGSAAWQWWPDAGFVMQRIDQEPAGLAAPPRDDDDPPPRADDVAFKAWRQPRNELTWWPKQLHRTGGWQWGPPAVNSEHWMFSDAGSPPPPASPDLPGQRHGAADADRSRWRRGDNTFLEGWEP